MFEDYIFDTPVSYLNIKRAANIAPEEFLEGWDWYIRHEGVTLPKAPYEKNLEEKLPLKLISQRGIHSPDYKKLHPKVNREHALAIRTNSTGQYEDGGLIHLPDGTWVMEYCAQKEKVDNSRSFNFNKYLKNNLYDGVPLGVLIQKGFSSYTIMGLAYIEQYNELTNTFVLHGPVNYHTDSLGLFNAFEDKKIRIEDYVLYEEIDEEDRRLRVKIEAVRREQQDEFRRQVYCAYNGQCAITKTCVEDVLQAAHIKNYMGKQTQCVNNGILLRSDIHLLYDSNMLAVNPEDFSIEISNSLKFTEYENLEGRNIALPKDLKLYPNEKLLYSKYCQFKTAQYL